MKYLLMIHAEEAAFERLSETDQQRMMAEYRQLREQLKAQGNYLDGSRLHPVSSATIVRVREGKRVVTDGPFAETREQLGGYFLVEARDLEEAVGIAARMPGAVHGAIEVRPLAESPAPAP